MPFLLYVSVHFSHLQRPSLQFFERNIGLLSLTGQFSSALVPRAQLACETISLVWSSMPTPVAEVSPIDKPFSSLDVWRTSAACQVIHFTSVTGKTPFDNLVRSIGKGLFFQDIFVTARSRISSFLTWRCHGKIQISRASKLLSMPGIWNPGKELLLPHSEGSASMGHAGVCS